MLTRIKKIAAEWGSHFTFVDYAYGIGKWAWSAIGTAFLAVLAAVTPWLQSAGPYGWFLAGLAGTFLLALASVPISALFARSLDRVRPARDARSTMQTKNASVQAPQEAEAIIAQPSAGPELTEDKQAKHDLAVFVQKYLYPAIETQWVIQDMCIGRLSRSPAVATLTRQGLDASENMKMFKLALHDP
jgi:hypothetical protein